MSVSVSDDLMTWQFGSGSCMSVNPSLPHTSNSFLLLSRKPINNYANSILERKYEKEKSTNISHGSASSARSAAHVKSELEARSAEMRAERACLTFPQFLL